MPRRVRRSNEVDEDPVILNNNVETVAEKLNNQNYETWIQDVQDCFMLQKLWDLCCDARYDIPVEEIYDVNLKNRVLKCRILIRKCVDEAHRKEFRRGGLESPYEIFEYLKRKYQRADPVKMHQTLRELSRLKLAEVGKEQELYDHFCELVNVYEAAGGKMSSVEKCLHYINCFPEEFSIETKMIRNGNVKEFVLDDVHHKLSLVDKELLMKLDKRNLALATDKRCFNCKKFGHVSKNCKLPKKHKDSNKPPTIKCFKCTGFGHVAKNCPTKTVKEDAEDKKKDGKNEKAYTTVTQHSSETWILDSGATSHCTGQVKLFSDIIPVSDTVITADGSKTLIEGVGTCRLVSSGEPFKLEHTLYIPDFKMNLMSVSRICDHGYQVLFDQDGCKVLDKGSVQMRAKRVDNLYVVEAVGNEKVLNASLSLVSDNLWHARLGHPGKKKLLKIFPGQQFTECESCILSKGLRTSHKVLNKNYDFLEMVSADLIGPLPCSFSGYKYVLNVIEHCTNFSCVYPFKEKTEVSRLLGEYLNYVKNQTGRNPKKILFDNGKEFDNHAVRKECQDRGITVCYTSAYTPSQNGKIERRNRTLIETARTLLNEAKLTTAFWCYAVITANYLLNLWPQKQEDRSSFELFLGKKPVYKHLRRFGCLAYWRVYNRMRRTKFSNTCQKMVFVGYTESPRNYVLFDTQRNVTVVTSDVKFNENVNGYEELCGGNGGGISELVDNVCEPDTFVNSVTADDSSAIPKVFKDVLVHPERSKWEEAIADELNSMKSLNVFEEVYDNVSVKPINTKWIFVKKDGGRYKARLVARGFEEDHKELDVYSPVAGSEILRLFLTMVAKDNLCLDQLDVKTAFLNSYVHRDVYVCVPEGMHTDAKLLKLNKALYGLNTSPRDWYSHLRDLLVKHGFKRFDTESCLFLKKVGDYRVMVLTYVDDILIASEKQELINELESALSEDIIIKVDKVEKEFKYLGVNILRDGNTFKLRHIDSIIKLVEKFGLSDCKKVDKLPKIETLESDGLFAKDEAVEAEYRSIVGSLMYISNLTRPDITHYVNVLAQNIKNCNNTWLKYAKKALRYLYHTKEESLVIAGDRKTGSIELYVDASYGSCRDMKSKTGYLVLFEGSPVSWKTSKQKTTATSTMEAEIIALYEGLENALWIKNIADEFGDSYKLIIYEDNQPAIKLVKDSERILKKKHLNIKLQSIKENISTHEIQLLYVDTKEQLADHLTKTLNSSLMNKLSTIRVGITGESVGI